MYYFKSQFPANLVNKYTNYAKNAGISVEKLWLVTFQIFLHRLTQESHIQILALIPPNSVWNVFSVEFNNSTCFSDLVKREFEIQEGGGSIHHVFHFHEGLNVPIPENYLSIISLEIAQNTTWGFDPLYYSQEEIRCIPQIFINFAKNLISELNQLCSRVSLLTSEQWVEMESSNHTEANFPSRATLHEMISAQAKRTPERIAAVYNDKRMTYSEMEQRSNSLAQTLVATGVQPGQVVGLYLERNLDLLVSQLAILKTGAAYAALDLQYPREMISSLIENFNLPFILTHSELVRQLPDFGSKFLLIDQLVSQKNLPMITTDSIIDSDSPAFIIFTSGSTGVPKGVIHTHRSMSARFQAACALAPMDFSDVISQTSPISSIDAVDEFYAPLLLGACVIIIPHIIVTDPRYLVDLLEREGVTRMILVPSLLRIMLTAYDDFGQRLIRLKTWLIGGEILTPALVNLFYEKHPQARLINFYGLTEGDATFYHVVVSEMSPPIGRPIQNRHVYLLDSQLMPVPPGLSGEICLSGEGLFKEYWNLPDLNNVKWVANPFTNSSEGSFDRIFKTGDMGRWEPDGQLQYLGRRDRIVKIRSFRVDLGEVEAALITNPSVHECAARVWQKQSVNDAVTIQPRIVCYVVLHPSAHITPNQLRNKLKEYLPEYALPKQIILLKALPVLPSGKIDYHALPEPTESDSIIDNYFTEPIDELELYLVNLWESLLEHHPISTQDNFFDLGGDSLLVIIMITELEKKFDQTFSLAMLFYAPTIVRLASAIREKGWKPAWSSLVPIRTNGSKPPLFCVHADGGAFFYRHFTSHLSPDQPVYGIQARGLDGTEEPFTKIEDMAKHYINEIRSIQPMGPYLISGFSMGGVIVYEMAQQLLEYGETSLVIFLDAPSPSYNDEIFESSSRKKLKRLMHLNIRDFLTRVIYRLKQRYRWLSTELLSRFYLRLGRPLSPTLRIHRVRELNQKIASQYKPAPYNGPVIVCRACEHRSNTQLDPTLGWSKYVNSTITDYAIPGNHESIFKEPNVQMLAERVQFCIDEWLANQNSYNPLIQSLYQNNKAQEF